jgi:hypothetical protein
VTIDTNEGAYRISGNYGEGYFIDPSGRRPPLKIMEATAITFTKSVGVVDVPLAGNRTGTKDGTETPGTGTLSVQEIDTWWRGIVMDALNQNLGARRAARDAGQRIARTFTLQVWEDDPEALGAIGTQLDGCRISDLVGGFTFGTEITGRDLNFRFERLTPLKWFERLGNNLDPVSGLPAVRYTTQLTGPPG